MSDLVAVIETSMLPEQPRSDNIDSPTDQVSASFLARKLLITMDELLC